MTRILIYKSKRLLCVEQDGAVVFSARIGLGPMPAGAKCAEGDGRTPEGVYCICTKNAFSKYTLFLGISYPSANDAMKAFQSGFISPEQLKAIQDAQKAGARPPWNTPLGGEIGIHGGGVIVNHTLKDNTAGCAALLDDDMRRLWGLAEIGTQVVIHP